MKKKKVFMCVREGKRKSEYRMTKKKTRQNS